MDNKTMSGLISGFRLLSQVIYTPENAFDCKIPVPSILVPLLVFGLLSAILASLQSPLQMRWTQAQMLAAGTPPEQVATQIEWLHKSGLVGLFATPLWLILRWTAFAFILWLTAQMILDQLDFRRTLGIVAYSYSPILIRDSVSFLVLSLRDAETLQRSDGLQAALGLNLIFPSLPRFWDIIAGSINIFELWYGALLVVGIAATTRARWPKALAVVLPGWLFVVLVQAGLGSFSRSLQHQLGS